MNLSTLRLWTAALIGGSLLTFSATSSSLAGATCLAETDDGMVVELELTSIGVYGAFNKAVLTVKDKGGAVIFENTYEEAGQFAATIHQGKAVVIFTALDGDSDVLLTFVGKDQDEYENDKLLAILRDQKRTKDPGNRMTVSVYKEGKEMELKSEDIVVTLHKDV